MNPFLLIIHTIGTNISAIIIHMLEFFQSLDNIDVFLGVKDNILRSHVYTIVQQK